MFVFVRCVAEAVCEVGVRGLVGLVPGGEYACNVAEKAYGKYRDRCKDQVLRDDLQRLAEATFDDGKQAAQAEAGRHNLPDADRVHLELFLTQLPASIRASLKRPDDPTGRSVPAAFALRSADDVLKMLPPRLPRGRAGDPLSGAPGWVLVEQLGVGGFGEVWLCRHEWVGTVGAVKFCHGLNARDLDHELRLVARVMAAGRHAGVVPVIAQNLSADPPWVMYEYVPGGDLADRVREWAGLPPADRAARAVAALRKLAEAVGRLHRFDPPVVHRDLKPSNVLFDPATGEFRVTDFGIGGVAAREVLRAEVTGQSTRGGRLLSYLRGSHTPLYASPQQRDGSDPDPRDDVHALGVIGYQMLTGHLSQGCGTDFEDDLRDAGAGDDLIRVLKSCTAQKADRRPKDAVAMAEAVAVLDPQVPTTEPAGPAEEALQKDYAGWLAACHRSPGTVTFLEREAPTRLDVWEAAAKTGHPVGQLLLGDCFLEGVGVEPNTERAVEWFQRAAGQGFHAAQVVLGNRYRRGEGVTRDYAEARRWYEAAAVQGYAGAQFLLGVLFVRGLGVQRDYARAAEWFQQAGDQGHAGAQCQLGRMCEDGHGVQQDYVRAAEWYARAAAQGDAEAQNLLGALYEDGQGVNRDHTVALAWFERAAGQGHALAQYNAGVLILQGEGVPRNQVRAVRWLRKAANQGDEDAVERLESLGAS